MVPGSCLIRVSKHPDESLYPLATEMASFEFVVTSGGPQPANKAARSHAIKTALQLRSKLSTGENPRDGAAESKRTAKSKNGLNGKFRLATPTRGHGDKRNTPPQPRAPCLGLMACKKFFDESQTIPPLVYSDQNHSGSSSEPGVEWLGLGFLDPFGTFPIPSNPRIDLLIKHCIIFFDYLTTTVTSNQTWLALAMHDPLLMCVTLSMTAAYGATQTSSFNKNLQREGLKLKGQVIHEVNRMIQNDDPPENTLAAIAHLGHIASLEGSPKVADVHMRGLYKLVSLRGGIRAINNYQVGRFINSIDLELATHNGRRPYFPLNYDLNMACFPHCITAGSENTDLCRFQSLGPGYETLVTVIHLLRQLIHAKKCNLDHTLRDVRVLSFSAAHLAMDHLAETPTTLEGRCLDALLLATHLFGCAALAQHHHWTRSIPPRMAQRLKESLIAWPTNSKIWSSYLPELLWALFIGTIVSQATEEKDLWFSSQLRVIWQILKGRTRKEFEGYLSSTAWDEIFGTELLDSWCYPRNDNDE